MEDFEVGVRDLCRGQERRGHIRGGREEAVLVQVEGGQLLSLLLMHGIFQFWSSLRALNVGMFKALS